MLVTELPEVEVGLLLLFAAAALVAVLTFINRSKSTMEEIDLIVFDSSLLSPRHSLRESQFLWMEETHRSCKEGSPAEGGPWFPLKSVFSVAKSLMAAVGDMDGNTDLSVSDRKISCVRVIRVALETQIGFCNAAFKGLHRFKAWMTTLR